MKDFVFLLFFHINEDILRKDLRIVLFCVLRSAFWLAPVMTINERWGITDGLTAVLASLFKKKIYENYGSHKIIVLSNRLAK